MVNEQNHLLSKNSLLKNSVFIKYALYLYVIYLGLFDFIEYGRLSYLHYISYIILGLIILCLLFESYPFSIHKIRVNVILWLPFVCLLFYHTINFECGWHYLLLFIVSLMLVNKIKSYRYCIGALKILKVFIYFYIFGIFIQIFLPSIYSIIEKILINETAANNQINSISSFAGFTAQVSHTAIYIILGIGIILYLRIIKNNTLSFISLVFCSMSLIFINKRAHLILLLFSLLIIFYLFGKKGKKLSRLILSLTIFFTLLISMYLFKNTLENIPLIKRIYETYDIFNIGTLDNVIDVSGRGILYDTAKIYINKYPNGIGWGMFRIMSTEYVSYSTSVHNIYLQLRCETGIKGLLLFLIPLIYNFVYTIIILYKSKKIGLYNSKLFGLGKFSLFIQIFWILYGFTGNPLYNENYVMMYFISLICISPLIQFVVITKKLDKEI